MLSPRSLQSARLGLRALIFALGSHALVACAAPAAPPPATPEPLTETASEPIEAEDDASAMLDILGAKPTQVLLDGKPIGTTPIEGYKVAPGSYDVTFVDEVGGNRTMAVTVGPGDSRIIKSDPSPTATVR